MTDTPNRLSPEERYTRDPWFRTLVDVLYCHLDKKEYREYYTPTELREAVMLAARRHESLQLHRTFVELPYQGEPLTFKRP